MFIRSNPRLWRPGWWNFVRPIEAWNRSNVNLSVKMAPAAGSNMANHPNVRLIFLKNYRPCSFASFPILSTFFHSRESLLYAVVFAWYKHERRIEQVVPFINGVLERRGWRWRGCRIVEVQLHPPVLGNRFTNLVQRSPSLVDFQRKLNAPRSKD